MNRIIRLLGIVNAIVFAFSLPFSVVYWRLGQMFDMEQSGLYAEASTTAPYSYDEQTDTSAQKASSASIASLSLSLSSHKNDTVSPAIAEPVLEQIALCESGGDARAKSSQSSAKGLLQIINGTWKEFNCTGSVLDPNDNMQCAIKIATQSGLHHWDESRSCWTKPVAALEHSAS